MADAAEAAQQAPPSEPEQRPGPEQAAPEQPVPAQPAPEPPAPEHPPAPQAASGPPVVLRGRYHIDPGRPMPELSTPSANAFHVKDDKEPHRALFALICDPALPVRVNLMSALKGAFPRGVIPLIEWDIIFWPPINRKTMTVVYERPRGGCVTNTFNAKNPLSEYDMPRRILQPLTIAMQELNELGITHRSIRVDNMFFMDEAKEELVLGDCVCAPPGYDQPVIYETISRALATPAARGPGEPKEDLYAIGVACVHLLAGRDPQGKKTDSEILDAKIEMGSYASLNNIVKIPLQLMEPMRGVLTDSINERWGIEELDLWSNGGQTTPVQRKTLNKADTPLRFLKKDHICGGTLARALLENMAEGVRLIKSGDVEAWVRRGLGGNIADAIHTAVDICTAKTGSPQGSDDFLVAKIAMILAPDAPIRYKSVSFMPEGFGAALAAEYLAKGNAQLLAEVLSLDLFSTWISIQPEVGPDHSALERNFGQLKTIIGNTNIGYGVERCLYELNPYIPCQGSLLSGDYVARIEDLLPALERIAETADHRTRPMDRHIAAFTAARFRQDVEPHLAALGDDDEAKSIIGMLSLLAAVQWRQNLKELKGMASWFGALLGPVIGSFHSKTTRRQLEKEIPAVVRKGDLAELFNIADNQERRQEDAEGYALARLMFKKAETEISDIENSEVSESDSAIRLGQQTAAMAAVVLMLTTIVISFFVLEN